MTWTFEALWDAVLLESEKSTDTFNADASDFLIVDLDSRTLLHRACALKLVNVVKYLVSKCDVNACDEANWTALHIAASNGSTEIVELLLNAANIDINIQTETGGTPIHYAASKGHLNICKKLQKRGAKLNILDRNGHSCITKAVCHNHNAIVKFLIKSGCDLNVKENGTEDNLLHIAVAGICPADVADLKHLMAWNAIRDGSAPQDDSY